MEKSAPNSDSIGDVVRPENINMTGRANSPIEPLPKRKKLPHEIPSWVQQGEKHFITINCQTRGINQLLQNDTAKKLLASAEFYEKQNRWYLWLMVVMPDHIHFIATFNLSAGVRSIITAWKRYQAIHQGIDWQSDFFEHRLRNHSEFEEKCHYIRMNPARKGLIENPANWPHVLDRISLDSGSLGELALPKPHKKETV